MAFTVLSRSKTCNSYFFNPPFWRYTAVSITSNLCGKIWIFQFLGLKLAVLTWEVLFFKSSFNGASTEYYTNFTYWKVLIFSLPNLIYAWQRHLLHNLRITNMLACMHHFVPAICQPKWNIAVFSFLYLWGLSSTTS